MKAIVLAAGFSTRLYPLTKYFPKGLLEIKKKALTGYVMDELVKQPEIDEIAFVTNHLYFSNFEKWLKDNYSKYKIKLLDNGVTDLTNRLGAIGDLQFVLDKTGWNDDLFVVASDTLISLDYGKLFEFFKTKKGFISIVFDTKNKETIKKKLGAVVLGKNDEIIEFIEKPEEPETTLAGTPYYIYPKNSLPLVKKYLADGHPKDAPGYIVPWFIGKIPVFGFKVQGYYYDVGTIDVYNNLSKNFLR